jgi:hypothetical protein
MPLGLATSKVSPTTIAFLAVWNYTNIAMMITTMACSAVWHYIHMAMANYIHMVAMAIYIPMAMANYIHILVTRMGGR